MRIERKEEPSFDHIKWNSAGISLRYNRNRGWGMIVFAVYGLIIMLPPLSIP